MTVSTSPFFTTARGALLSSVLALEAEAGQSRQSVTVLAGAGSARALLLGTVLGRRLFGALTIAAIAGITGNGAVSAASLGTDAKVGTYTLTCIAAAANGGRFQVVDPDGYRLADALVGVAYVSPQVKFTVGDGATDYVVGDTHTITVAAGDGKVVMLDPAATDGTQLADSVLIVPVTAPDGTDAPGQSVTRFATLIDSGLIWPVGISAPAKAAALKRFDRSFLRTVSAA